MFRTLQALFKSSESEIKVIDKVWMSTEAKFKACAAMAAVNANCIFICWFEETHYALQKFLGEEQLILADRTTSVSFLDKMIVFAEHHPLSRKEAALFKSLNLKEVPVLSSLDEPFFMWFGGDRTIELMKKLGMDENEIVSSNIVTKAIRNAQQKIEKQVVVEREATSAQEWLNLNLPSK